VSKRANRWLGVTLLALIGLSAALLLSLRGSEEGAHAPSPRQDEIAPASPPPRRTAARPPAVSPARQPGRAPARIRAVEVDAGPTRREPLGVHSAPAAVPVEIADEKDPEKKARLMRMHTLAVARSRASRLRRRRRQLETTLARGRREGNWSQEQVQRTQDELSELKRAIDTAEDEVRQAEERVKPDR
jgi:hypothetical protein